MLVLKGLFGGSPKITLQKKGKITRKVKNNPKRFLGGVGGIFPFFSFSFVLLRFSSLFFVFLRCLSILLEQGQTTAIYWDNGEFHSDPVCTDPVRNFPKISPLSVGFPQKILAFNYLQTPPRANKPPNMQLITNPPFAIHQVFEFSISKLGEIIEMSTISSAD